jgi:hypothetical protein
MRKINYKTKNSHSFEIYVDIGCSDRISEFMNIYIPDKSKNSSEENSFSHYCDWFEKFKLEPIGSKMLILNFYLSEYMGLSIDQNQPQIDYFESVYGKKTLTIIKDNLNYFLNFNKKWFNIESPLFKGLDLTWDDISEKIIQTKESEVGIITEVQFDDGSIFQFFDEDDSLRSFYVPEIEYLDLKNQIQNITSKFQP